MSNDKIDVLKQASIYTWQKRNFSMQDNDLDHTHQKTNHLCNIAQIVFAIQNHKLDNTYANLLIQEELDSSFSHKSIINQKKESSILDEEEKSNHINNNSLSQLNFNSCMKDKLIKDLASSINKSIPLWMQEVKCNSSLSLFKPKNFKNTSSNKNGSTGTAILNNETNVIENNKKSTMSHCSSSRQYHSHTSAILFTKQKEVKRKYEDAQSSDEDTSSLSNCFKSAREQLAINQKKKLQRTSPQGSCNKKSLGSRPRNQCYAKFIPPSNKDNKEDSGSSMLSSFNKQVSNKVSEEIDPKLKGIEPQLVELVMSEIMDHGPPIGWDDIAGLEFAKATIKEIVIWPMLRPDIFTGLRGPPKGILLFGPPGTGKTLIGKCIANQSGATFFSISASSLTSKWIGQAEKMVRALFAVASLHQPAVIFIDEIDSLLSQRSDSEHESSRRIKTEFFVQLDGATTSSEDRILVVGATNRPQEIDEAARRRLVKRLYIPLPDDGARKQIVTKLLTQQPCVLSHDEILEVVAETSGYSGADVTNLCKDAALGPIRSLQGLDISKIRKDDVRPIKMEDFRKSLKRVRASVSQQDLVQYEDWNKIYGCSSL